MNKRTMIENIRNEFRMWNDLKTREVEAGILTEEKYQELKAESLRRTEEQINYIKISTQIEK